MPFSVQWFTALGIFAAIVYLAALAVAYWKR